jgi:mannose-1-phosphate guanylyltransferase
LKALFLAGGMGTRLRPLTNHIPKPMVPVMGVPLLARSVRELKRCGISEIVLSTCYCSDRIEKYFGDEINNGLKIQCVCEGKPLGTGGAIKNCQKYFDGTFLIFNSDILSNIDVKAMVDFHKKNHADVTIAAAQVKDPSSYGVIEYDSDDKIVSFTEKPKSGEEKSNYINAGVYVFEPKVLDLIPSGIPVSVERDTFPLLLKKGYHMAVFRKSEYWIDIGTPEKYMQAHKDIFDGSCSIPENNFKNDKIYGLANAKLDPTVKIKGPVWFGKNVHIGANAVIGPNVVIGNGFEAGRGCEITNSVIWSNVSVGSGVDIEHSVITSGCHIENGTQCANTIYSQESKLPFA